MEKFKDILHDFTDVAVAIGIAVLMFAVVAFNLGDWFNLSTLALASSTLTPSIEEPVKEEAPKVQPVVEKVEKVVEEVKKEEKTEEKVVEEKEKPVEKPVEKPTSSVTVVEIKRIVIPNGSPGMKIARILQDNGLIEDQAAFIKTAEDLKLLLKLKPGSFEIPTNATLEEIVKLIAK